MFGADPVKCAGLRRFEELVAKWLTRLSFEVSIVANSLKCVACDTFEYRGTLPACSANNRQKRSVVFSTAVPSSSSDSASVSNFPRRGVN
jgi:hypothetical protein